MQTDACERNRSFCVLCDRTVYSTVNHSESVCWLCTACRMSLDICQSILLTLSRCAMPVVERIRRSGASTERRGSIEDDDNFFVREYDVDKNIHDVYDFTGPVLGSGSFATILRVKDRGSGIEYAVKQISLKDIKSNAVVMQMLENEIEGMKMMSHPNIIRLQEVYRPKDEEMLYLVLDRLEGGSADQLRRQEGHLQEDHAAYIMTQVIDAVRYCHNLGIAHRDLKLANCMFEDTSPAPVVKVIDFGLCADLKDGKTSSAFAGTMVYAAPEVVKANVGHGLQCDMWSVGIMTYTLIGGLYPFFSEDEAVLQNLIKFGKYSYSCENWEGVSDICRDFIDKCLVKDPKRRITPAQAQEHPWLKKAAEAMREEPLSKGAVLAMMKFQESNMFQKIAMELVAYTCEPSQIRELEKHFREWDKDGNGTISLSEFKAAIMDRRRAIVQAPKGHEFPPEAKEEAAALMAVTGQTEPVRNQTGDKEGASASRGAYGMVANLDEEAVEKMFGAMDINNDGHVGITEFVAACLQKREVNLSAIAAAFQRLDVHRTGLISCEDMRGYLGDLFEEHNLEDCMSKISCRNDGQVTFEDFLRCLKAHRINAKLPASGAARGRPMPGGSSSAQPTATDGRPIATDEKLIATDGNQKKQQASTDREYEPLPATFAATN